MNKIGTRYTVIVSGEKKPLVHNLSYYAPLSEIPCRLAEEMGVKNMHFFSSLFDPKTPVICEIESFSQFYANRLVKILGRTMLYGRVDLISRQVDLDKLASEGGSWADLRG